MSTLSKLELALSQSHVFIKHPDVVKTKIAALIADGPSELQVISDFDKTITKARHLGRSVSSSHHIIESHHSIPDHIKEELTEMHHKYHDIETDHELSITEKIPHMIDWASNGSELIKKAEVKRTQLPKMVADSNACLRDGFDDFSQKLSDIEVPLLIFSAGVGDIVEEVIKQHSKFHPQMQVIANYMEFGEDEKLVGFKGKLIHTFNKNGEFIKMDAQWGDKCQGRRNVILFGDMIGDLTMADGVKDRKTCLKIGFLNAKFEQLLDSFMDQWDIVLEDDQTMDVANAIIDELRRKSV